MEYRHQCHVGDHGDALKHPVLASLIQALVQNHPSLNIIDTHAGTGCYDLTTAPKNHAGEFKEGVGFLWKHRQSLPPSFNAFISTLAAFNPEETLTLYPGSAAIGFEQGRRNDSFFFSDIQQDEADLLATNIKQIRSDLHIDSKLHIFAGDGLVQLPHAVSDSQSHNLIVIDPPYETDGEYLAVIDALVAAWQQQVNITALVWYPLYTEDKSHLILDHCTEAVTDGKLPTPLQAELRLRDPKDDDRLIGSGLLVFNPPQCVPPMVTEVLDYLHTHLATKHEGYWQLKR
ncbi:23S rRNA (adenine(2030)-N(6))-methyltransferase RlmJ [Vibrio sp. T187]|uniref:23S rRNA (adenine(2030)-N(6))-methyltransferase RlmJ n=1 Tax=Vibrio TaxID=662 RepID=UPI0010C9FF35|nr:MULTISPECIES: 23S rRNA (adenine(2030)-N(6))-methyltransferase RlmJ [Vibrio]MBW3695211.1 23S rRNA (adenine(2030)-N(6))-methyltransferase RlmJ [Vibrio sp. T187]